MLHLALHTSKAQTAGIRGDLWIDALRGIVEQEVQNDKEKP
jgi:hypothetical protein